jgi:sugar phosphate isomerase/epimerase
MKSKKIPVGIQLYSLRDVMPKDVPGTLRKVAKMGYEGVEFAGYYNLSGNELRKMLDDCSLACMGSHTGLDTLEGDAFEKTVETNKALGTDLLIVPWDDLKDVPKLIDRLNAVYQKAKECGMRAGYHNHAREFEMAEGQTFFDRIFAATPPDFLVQLDIGWAAHAGQDVAAILRKHNKRMVTVHVKESSRTNPAAAVGEGDVNWREVFKVTENKMNLRGYIVEQEKFAVGPLESAQTCINNIRALIK